MYSGQEIVSQEECKIVLAEFYEGVNCFNDVDRTISFTLLDWALATYDSGTQTLTTPNFTCRPLIMTQEDIRITFEAEIPASTTGLEVHMTVAEYNKTRIMPLIYLPICNMVSWEWPYPGSMPYANIYCNEATETKVELFAELDVVTSTKITVVGYQSDGTTEPLYLEFLDDNDQLMTLTPTFSVEATDITEWKYNSETEEYEEVTTSKDMLIIKVDLAKSIVFSGIYDYTALLYPCSFSIGDIYDYCNLTDPYETRVSSFTDTFEILDDGWFQFSDNTEFRLLPTHKFLRSEALQFFFSGAKQIEFRLPTKATYDILPCSDNPDYCFFHIYPILYYEEGEWLIDIIVSEDHTTENNCITDSCSGDVYCFFTGQDNPINITSEYLFGAYKEDVSWCNAYYTKNGGANIEITAGGNPTTTDSRVIWDQSKCKFIVTCESIGYFPCPCMACDNLPDGESAHVYADSAPSETCTDGGNLLKDTVVRACEAGIYHPIGVYPEIPVVEAGTIPSASTYSTDYIYISGLSMYMFMRWPMSTQVYVVAIGNLAVGIDLKEIEDEATGDKKTVNILPFIYLDTFKFPYEYITSSGLDDALWSDRDIWSDFGETPTEKEALMSGISPAGGGYDFKITLSSLNSRLPSGWKGNYDWRSACGWSSATINRLDFNFDEVITVDNTDVLDGVSCEQDFKVKYVHSNIPLNYGRGIILPIEAYGAYQEIYDAFVETINLLVSEDAEAYAYYNKIYAEELPEEEG